MHSQTYSIFFHGTILPYAFDVSINSGTEWWNVIDFFFSFQHVSYIYVPYIQYIYVYEHKPISWKAVKQDNDSMQQYSIYNPRPLTTKKSIPSTPRNSGLFQMDAPPFLVCSIRHPPLFWLLMPNPISGGSASICSSCVSIYSSPYTENCICCILLCRAPIRHDCYFVW